MSSLKGRGRHITQAICGGAFLPLYLQRHIFRVGWPLMDLGVWRYRYLNTRYTVDLSPAASGGTALNVAAKHACLCLFLCGPIVGTATANCKQPVSCHQHWRKNVTLFLNLCSLFNVCRFTMLQVIVHPNFVHPCHIFHYRKSSVATNNNNSFQ